MVLEFFFANSTKWISNFYEMNHFKAAGFKKFTNLNKIVLWKEWPSSDKEFLKLIKDGRENFNYDNAIILNYKYDEYIDSISLRGFPGDDGANHRYFSNLEYIENFINYFIVVFAKAFSSYYKRKLIIPEESINLISNYNKNLYCNSINLDNFINSEECIFIDNYGLCFSKRESQCIAYLILGYSIKEISDALNISSRTCEIFLLNIRKKLNCNIKSKMIRNLISNQYNKKLIFSLLDS